MPNALVAVDHVDAAGEEIVLRARALLVPQPGVVAPDAEPQARQDVGPELDRLSGGGVHDARGPDIGDEALERGGLLVAGPAWLDREREIGRSKPVTSSSGSRRPSCAAMSARTSGVAVAVNAAAGTSSSARKPASRR